MCKCKCGRNAATFDVKYDATQAVGHRYFATFSGENNYCFLCAVDKVATENNFQLDIEAMKARNRAVPQWQVDAAKKHGMPLPV